jgi:hypothetical protein
MRCFIGHEQPTAVVSATVSYNRSGIVSVQAEILRGTPTRSSALTRVIAEAKRAVERSLRTVDDLEEGSSLTVEIRRHVPGRP